MNNFYEKPNIKFTSLKLNENVSDQCWSSAANNSGQTVWYFDPNGNEEGYFSFRVIPAEGGKQCGTVDIIIEGIFNYPADQKPDDQTLIDSLVRAAGGNNGQPFNEGSGIQDNPGGMS